MLGWALRYLTVVLVLGVGVALLQESDWLKPTTVARTPQPSITRNAAHVRSADEAGSDAWEYVVEAEANGHFVIDATVDGVPITFLLDTGASDIVLTLDDARQLGFAPRTLEFSQRFQTANGVVRGAPVRLRELRIGQFSLYDQVASVNEAPLAISLLGMRFLDQLSSYRVEDGRLILRW
jgi:clan AA aspartic protease (TIGR02281 family)